MKQLSQEWFDARKGRITGSSVGAILGFAPYASQEDILRRMVRDYHGTPSEFEGNVATQWGSANEDTAKGFYELEECVRVKPASFVMHPDIKWLGASPDGYIGEHGIVEIKCPFGLRKQDVPQFKSINEQDHYYAQIQIQLYCTGRKWCDFYQWVPSGSKLERVEFSKPYIDVILPKLEAFYQLYLSEIDNHEHLQPLRKEINTNTAKLLLAEYDDMCEAEDRAKERKAEIMEELQIISGGKDALIHGRKLTKVERKGSVAYAKVVKDHCPDVDLSEYTGKSSESWRLT
jgi:putative phage-type endonuclease